jgi:hypothetical protein
MEDPCLSSALVSYSYLLAFLSSLHVQPLKAEFGAFVILAVMSVNYLDTRVSRQLTFHKFSAFLMAYAVLGTLYNRYILRLRGVDQIPQFSIQVLPMMDVHAVFHLEVSEYPTPSVIIRNKY